MFYQRFEELKISLGEKGILGDKLKDLILSLPINLRIRITPSFVAKKLDISKEVANDLLYQGYLNRLLLPRFEVICPCCDKTFKTVNDLSEIMPIEVCCEECEESFVPSPQKIWVTYSLLPEFRELTDNNYIEQENKTNCGDDKSALTLADTWADPLKFLEQLFKPNLDLLSELVDNLTKGRNNDEKKLALETLAEHITSSIVGFSMIGKNVRTTDSEIDRLYRNLSMHPLLQKMGSPITVECKNYKSKVTTQQIRIANDNAKEYNANTCLYFSVQGVSGNTSRDGWARILEIFREDKR